MGAVNLCYHLVRKIELEYRDQLADAPYDLVKDAYDILVRGSLDVSIGYPPLWLKAVVLGWLNANAIDLATISELNYENLNIFVHTRDFNADGKNEYFLEISDGNSVMLYLVVQSDADGGYALIETPLPYHHWTTLSYSDLQRVLVGRTCF